MSVILSQIFEVAAPAAIVSACALVALHAARSNRKEKSSDILEVAAKTLSAKAAKLEPRMPSSVSGFVRSLASKKATAPSRPAIVAASPAALAALTMASPAQGLAAGLSTHIDPISTELVEGDSAVELPVLFDELPDDDRPELPPLDDIPSDIVTVMGGNDSDEFFGAAPQVSKGAKVYGFKRPSTERTSLSNAAPVAPATSTSASAPEPFSPAAAQGVTELSTLATPEASREQNYQFAPEASPAPAFTPCEPASAPSVASEPSYSSYSAPQFTESPSYSSTPTYDSGSSSSSCGSFD